MVANIKDCGILGCDVFPGRLLLPLDVFLTVHHELTVY